MFLRVMEGEYKITKSIKKEIGTLAGQLLPSYYEANAIGKLTGRQLNEQGVFEIDGKEIDPEKEYIVPGTKSFPVNHKRRMLKIYSKLGKAGIIEYIKGQTEIQKAHEPINLHSRLV